MPDVVSQNTMGIYDRIEFDEDLDTELPGFEGTPSEIVWQTKSLKEPLLETYRVSEDGRLLKEEVEYEEIEDEERETPGDLPNLPKRRKVHLDWSDVEYHGIFEFHRTVDDEYRSFEAKFTDGKLVGIAPSE